MDILKCRRSRLYPQMATSRLSALATVSPPKPESKIPIGWLLGIYLIVEAF